MSGIKRPRDDDGGDSTAPEMTTAVASEWVKKWSKTKGRYYWFNTKTGKSQWNDVNPADSGNKSGSKRHFSKSKQKLPEVPEQEVKEKKQMHLVRRFLTVPSSSSSSGSSSALDLPSGGGQDLPGNIPSGKKNFFFANVPETQRKALQLDQEAMYSVTNSGDADKMSELIAGHLGGLERAKTMTITDGTSCIGGNSVSFAKYFKVVNAVEIDEIRFNMLVRNTEVLSLGHRVHCYQGNYVEGYTELTQDCIFVDPPWGGPDMMSLDRTTFPLGGVCLKDLCHRWKSQCRVLCFKLSPNYDLSEFTGIGKKQAVYRQFRKMILVVIEF